MRQTISRTTGAVKRSNTAADLFGTDWAFPLRSNGRGGLAMVSGETNLQQALEDHCDVCAGELLYDEDYGAGTPLSLHDALTENVAYELARRIEQQVMKFEPRVKAITVLPEVDYAEERIVLRIRYREMYYQHEQNHTYPILLRR
jgi:uncharacterized protein